MSEYRVASRYARSLLALAEEKGVIEEVHNDMLSFLQVCEENRAFVLMLKNPVIKHDKKGVILEQIFKGRASDLTLTFFEIITRKNREAALPAIAKEFHNQYNAYKGIELATVTTAVPLDKGLRLKLEELVKKMSSKEKVELIEIVDKDVIGGYVLKVGDRQIDDTLRSKLKELELQFSQNPYIKEF
ncbi:ATP synthase delta chain [Fulvivirga imtechensis AK7]|uniref:ATP synthase subunit delta n=1 Tax=Fulvivirga imtechensis AK7 TaxID=1237149 RepID=L8JLU4_9BACT|nr:ATP synthase F1 subunit delta [Fulvivirga imtechensis]ELR69901.1 ATP synthase delta chain [Fulvivirga imtechensis AK7]